MLAAGLKGIEEGLEPPEPIEENVYEMTPKEREARGIGTLPASLEDAIALTEKSKLVKEALGEHVFNAFIENKKIEWNQYRIHVSKYELDRYLPML
jgi:glutamine synthetase